MNLIIDKLPPVPAQMTGFKVYLLYCAAILMVAQSTMPSNTWNSSDIYHQFGCCDNSLAKRTKSKYSFNLKRTVKQLFPLIGTLVAVEYCPDTYFNWSTGFAGNNCTFALIWLVYIDGAVVPPVGEQFSYGIAIIGSTFNIFV